MNIGSIPWGWFDLIVVALLIAGVIRGRINGMSKELIPLLQWLAIAVGGAFGYKPLAQYMAQLTMMDLLYCNVMSYMLIAVAVFILVMSCKHTLEKKLLGADLFGRLEFYLGMVSGPIRYACMIVFVMALLNARLYSAFEIERDRAAQREVYGNEFFPKMYTIQATVFSGSMIGRAVKENLPWLLIEPREPGGQSPQQREWYWE